MSATSVPTETPSALVANFSKHYGGLLRFLTRRTGDPDTARDLVHDTWVRLAERDGRADGASAGQAPLNDERAYLYTVAANLASNLQRHAARGDERFTADVDPDLAPSLPATGDVAHVHVMREAVVAVEAALQALPERRRRIFLAHRLDDVPQATLAAEHGVSVKTIEREVQESMDAIHRALLLWRGDTVAPSSAKPVRTRRQALSALLGVAGLGVLGLSGLRYWRHAVAQFEVALRTPKGRLLRQELPDGSRITLDADGQAEVAFYGDRRDVVLKRGTAFFEVERDFERPFSVATGLARVTVLGTRFEVDTGAHHIAVAVESGRVEVQSTPRGGAPQTVVLTAGQRVRIDDTGRAAAEPGGAPAVAAWRDGWLDLGVVPLGDALQRLARYSDSPIKVDARVAGLEVLARVRVADLSQWVQLLPQLLPVRVRQEDGGWAITPA